jgi:hypothetical protein
VVTEWILLLAGVMIVASLFMGTLKATFTESGPRLGARIEKHLETGSRFRLEKNGGMAWEPPPKKPKVVNQ